MVRPRASLSGLAGGPSMRKTRPMSVIQPEFADEVKFLSASSTLFQKIASYSFSGVPGVGSRFSQNVLAKAARSSSVCSFFQSFSSSSVMIHLTGPLAQSLLGVLQSGGPAPRARKAATRSGAIVERRIVIFTSREIQFHFSVRKGEDYTGGSPARQTPGDTGGLSEFRERPRAGGCRGGTPGPL